MSMAASMPNSTLVEISSNEVSWVVKNWFSVYDVEILSSSDQLHGDIKGYLKDCYVFVLSPSAFPNSLAEH